MCDAETSPRIPHNLRASIATATRADQREVLFPQVSASRATMARAMATEGNPQA